MALLTLALYLLCGGTAVFGAEVRITTPQGLINFSNSVNNGTTYSGTTVFLSSDIDLSGKTFEPIGNFLGVFDAQGYIISNLIMKTSIQCVGIFGVMRGSTIKNVVVDSSCSFASSWSGSSAAYIGGIVSYCATKNSQCLIENSVNMATISFNGVLSIDKADVHIGGIAGVLSCSQNYNFVIEP